MSRRFYTADPHFGHAKVSSLRGYSSTEEHDAAIVEAWREVVKPGDSVYVLGDLSVGGVNYALETVDSLPGTKHLIAGNHDYCHPMFRSAAQKQAKYLQVFKSVQLHAYVNMHGKKVLMSHLPYGEMGREPVREDRLAQWRPRDVGARLLHGHVHENWFRRGRQLNVGVDHHLAPWSEQELYDWVSSDLVRDLSGELCGFFGAQLLYGSDAAAGLHDFCDAGAGEREWLRGLIEHLDLPAAGDVSVQRLIQELERIQDRL